jgi:hypothetical protein
MLIIDDVADKAQTLAWDAVSGVALLCAARRSRAANLVL